MSYTMLGKGILGTKLGMTQIYQDNGDVVPCTIVEAAPNTVTQVKRADGADGYEAVQLAFGTRREKVTSKPMLGHFKAHAKTEPKRWIREVRMAAGAAGEVQPGSTVDCSVFAAGEYVDVIGTMKGRGFSGVVRRHGFATQKESHGAHYHWRHGGSIGCRKPEHVRKGHRMCGHMGAVRRTAPNLLVVRVDLEKGLIYLRGAVPGPNGGLLMVRGSKKRRTQPAA